MAAGVGSLLRPITDVWPKPVLPIDGRPVIGALLRELAAAGVESVYVVTGHLAEQVEALVGDGRAFGVGVRYVRQPEPLGSADTVLRSLRAGARPPLLVAGADTLFTPGDIGRFVDAAAGAHGAIAGRRDPSPSPPHRFAMQVVDGRVRRVLDDDPASPLSGAPLWLVGPEMAAGLDPLPGGPPYELAKLFQLGIDRGFEIAGVEIGRTRDLTHPPDLVRENFPYLGSGGR